ENLHVAFLDSLLVNKPRSLALEEDNVASLPLGDEVLGCSRVVLGELNGSDRVAKLPDLHVLCENSGSLAALEAACRGDHFVKAAFLVHEVLSRLLNKSTHIDVVLLLDDLHVEAFGRLEVLVKGL